MRTTVTLDDEVFIKVRSLAKQRSTSLGDVLSQLVRQALTVPPSAPRLRNGIEIFQPSPSETHGTLEFVNELRDAEVE